MAKLIFSAITSLDGYNEDETGAFDWGAPDDEVFRFITELERPIETYLYGRRMYETMIAWETASSHTGYSELEGEFANVWRAAEKIVYSTSLDVVSGARTRIETVFDPASVEAMKSTSERDLTIGGPQLAARAFEAGIVDECQLFVVPHVVGGGKRTLPKDVRLGLELLDEVRFTSGVVFLHYRIR